MHGHRSAIAVLTLATLAVAQKPPVADPLVVHEWGTFTSMQGSDGASLEGLQWEEESLPRFVHSLSRFATQRAHQAVGKKLARRVRRVTQKMETPVLYFHTNTRRKVRVRVDFVNGLMTQWYPVAESFAPWPEQLPRAAADQATPFDLSKIRRSHLQWHVELIPLAAGLPAGIPVVPRHDPWQFAREVGAASVRTIPARRSKLKPEAERYLFYRGLGTFQLPIQVRAARGGRAAFRNGDAHPIPFAVAMEVGPRGGRMRQLGAVAAGSSARFGLEDLPYLPIDRFVSRVHQVVVRTLIAQGLRTDEATAMVRTWSRQWFKSPGHRVIYVLPRPRVDALLPLKITPRPDSLVRVLVGRLEYLTPEVEDRVERSLRGRFSADAAVRQASARELEALGRFLEPKLRRVVARSGDATLRQNGARVLEQLPK